MSATLIVDAGAAEKRARHLFPSASIVSTMGLRTEDPDLTPYKNAEIVLWCHSPDLLADQLSGTAAKISIVQGEKFIQEFNGNAEAVRHWLRANVRPYEPPTCISDPRATPDNIVAPAPSEAAVAVSKPVPATVTPITEARTRRQEKPKVDEAELPSQYGHDTLAAQFTTENPDWRHVAEWSKWLRWSGAYWERDTTGIVMELARQVCRTAAYDARSRDIPAATIRGIVAKTTIEAVEKIARSDPAHARTAEHWDADPWLLNTPGGIVDLRDGSLRPGRPEDHATRITRGVPATDSYCPTWMQFLADATNNNADLMRYLQRVVGYFLTGSVRDHALFFVHGNGGNGKGTFLRTINWVLNDYAWTADADVFIEQKNPQHKTELASFMGRRLVSSEEINEGARWNEARINKLTGGDTITANFMRQDQFSFVPTHKLLIVANNKPLFRNVGDAIRRRLHLIPFTHKIEKPDGRIEDRLRADSDGILRWAVAGCLEWQRIGLEPPELVRLATGDYLASQDALSTWIEECLALQPSFSGKVSDVYANFKSWAEVSGEGAMGRRRFVEAMATRGHISERIGGTYYLRGLQIKPSPSTQGAGLYND
jgi:putative DNA primase/helicase